MFQNRSGVAHATIMVLMAGGQRPAAGLHLLPRATHLALSSPLSLPPFPFLHLATAVRARPTSTWSRKRQVGAAAAAGRAGRRSRHGQMQQLAQEARQARAPGQGLEHRDVWALAISIPDCWPKGKS
jgi:hypothetical protein